MLLRFYIDPSTKQPHTYGHNVNEDEVEDVMGRPIEDRRYLRVIYVPDPEPSSAFVITAYDLGPNALKALRRRQRRRKKKS